MHVFWTEYFNIKFQNLFPFDGIETDIVRSKLYYSLAWCDLKEKLLIPRTN